MTQFMDFTGKVVIITGGGAGIGAAIARAFDALGARVGVLDLDEGRAAAVAGSFRHSGFAGQIDVRDRSSVEQAMTKAITALGGFDVLAANAGVSSMCRAVDLTDEDWEFNMSVNAKGIFLANQFACRHFLKTGLKGCIVNTASLASKVGAPFLAHYSASKFAVLGWTQALAREMAPHGIRVNAVCPGLVKTSMQDRELGWEAELRGMTRDEVFADYIAQTPLGRIEEPEDVADVVTFLASDGARFMTGQGINVTGGIRM